MGINKRLTKGAAQKDSTCMPIRRLLPAIALLAVTIFAFPLTALTVRAQTGSGGKTETHTILVNGTERTYRIHLPPSGNLQEALPLVIALHGGGGNPEQFARDTGFDNKADAEGFIVVYPRGTGLLPTWNAIHCC